MLCLKLHFCLFVFGFRAILESSSFPCAGATKANSATVHAGFDPSPGTKKAYYNVLGSKLYPEICNFLHVPYFKNRMIVFAKNDAQKQELYSLKDKADRNKVRADLLAHKELLRIEPDIPASVLRGLYIPDSAMTSPFELAFSMADFAVLNGAVLKTSSPVRKIIRDVNGYKVTTGTETYFCKTIANCAGTHTDIFHNMISEDKIHITPREGQHLVLDKCLAPYVHTTICQTPEPLPQGGHTKGMGMMPSADGTILLGANAANVDDRNFSATTSNGINQIISWFKDNWYCFPISNHVKEFPENSIITAYGGCRAHEVNDDFIIGEPEDAPGFFDIAGIESPGLTSAPAIAKDVASWITDYLQRKKKPSYMEPEHTLPFRLLSQKE